jgi:HK97 family phage major capsid protein
MPESKENSPADPTGFESKVLKGVESLQTKQDVLVQNYEQLQKETKTAFEELTKVKNSLNSVAEFQTALKKVELQMKREQRMAFGDPLRRIANDPELRMRANIALRLAVDKGGDMQRLMAPHIKALGEDASPGSTLINDALANEIYDLLGTYGVWNTFGVRTVGTKTTKFPLKTARPVANFVLTESDTIADDTNKTGTAPSLTAEVIAVLLNVSMQLLEDSEFDVTSDILADFAEACALRMDYAALVADGTSDATNGGFTGIFEGGTAATAASGNTTTETLDLDDFVKVLTVVDPVVLTRPSRWWIHPTTIARTLAVKDDNGRSIFLTAVEAPTYGGIGSILGYPVTPAHAAPNANTAGSTVAAFGDPNGNVIALRRAFTFEASDHHKWNTLQRSFRGWGRAGTGIRAATAFGILTTAAS